MVVEVKYGGYVLKDMNMIQDLEAEQGKKIQVVVLIVVDKRLVMKTIFYSYSQRLQMNGIPPRMGS